MFLLLIQTLEINQTLSPLGTYVVLTFLPCFSQTSEAFLGSGGQCIL